MKLNFLLQKIIEMQLHIHYNKDEVETEYISAQVHLIWFRQTQKKGGRNNAWNWTHVWN